MKTRLSATLAVTVIGLGALTACGGGDEIAAAPETTTEAATTEPAPEPTTPEPTTPEPTEAATQEPTDAAAPADGAGAPVAVGETITDDVMGDTITVTQLVRDFVVPDFPGIAEDGGEFVLVEIDAVAGNEFSGGIQGGFTLLKGGELAGAATTIADDAMTAAGYTPFEGISSGETGTGWVAFQVNTRADVYELQYKRLAATVIGSDQEIPEQIWTVPLP